MTAKARASTLARLARLEAAVAARARPPAESSGWSIEEQAKACRALLAACARGHVERTPEGYRAITDPSRWQERFEVEPGRWDKRCLITPEMAEGNTWIAEFLTALFQQTGRYFPIYEGIANQPNPQFLEAVYRHYGTRFFA